MNRRKKILLALILLFLAAGSVYALYMWNKPARDVTEEKGIRISAVAIFDSFRNNERSSNIRFLNKAIEVTGKVINIKNNQAGKVVVYLQSNDPVFGVNCTFKQNPGEILKGDLITFKGICTGYLSDVVLNEGVLINKSK